MKNVFSVCAIIAVSALLMGNQPQDSLEAAKNQMVLKTLDAYKKAVELSLKAVQMNPQNYEANWVCAKAHRLYGDESRKQNVSGWKQICKEYGKKGMGYAEKAISISPDKIDGHFWYGANVGTYADGVSVLTALREGLKDKTQKGFETSYKMNKMYEDGYPIKGLGRFWSVLPWPLKDKKRAILYLEEFQILFPNDPEGQAWLGEVYKDAGEKDKARAVLTKVCASSDKYYSDNAKRLLSGL
jgi:tetratricopeptide (TPR) repeat protein